MAGTIPGAGITTPLTLTVDDNSDNLTLVSTDADASAGPNLQLYRNSSSPADNDFLGNVKFVGRNDNSQDVQAAEIEVYLTDVSDGAEDGLYNLNVMTNGTNTTYLQARADEGLVINNDSIDMDFRVESDNIDDALFVEGSTGNVGIGTKTPQNNLDVTGTSDSQVTIRCATTSNDSYISFRAGTDLHWYIKANFNSGVETLEFIDYAEGSNNVRMTFATNGQISGNFNNTSDISLKKEVTTLPSSDFVKNLNPVSFKWKEDDREDKGFIAQEVAALDSSLVSGEDGRKAINVTGIVAELTKSLQEAMAKIEALETSNTDLKNRVTALEG
jgi:hypothetical protein